MDRVREYGHSVREISPQVTCDSHLMVDFSVGLPSMLFDDDYDLDSESEDEDEADEDSNGTLRRS